MLLIIMHRLLQSFALPPFNAMIILCIGLLIYFKSTKISISIIISGIIFLYVQSIPYTAYKLNNLYLFPALDLQQLESSQAIVVIGGGLNKMAPEYPSGINENGNTALRINYAAFLAKIAPHKTIIVSGGYAGNIKEADIMQATLVHLYNVTNPIILENKSRNTDENAHFVSIILHDLKIKKIILITQVAHMRRTLMLFHKYGVDPIPAPTAYYSDDNVSSSILAFIPNANSMSQIAFIYHELIGYWIYHTILPLIPNTIYQHQ